MVLVDVRPPRSVRENDLRMIKIGLRANTDAIALVDQAYPTPAVASLPAESLHLRNKSGQDAGTEEHQQERYDQTDHGKDDDRDQTVATAGRRHGGGTPHAG